MQALSRGLPNGGALWCRGESRGYFAGTLLIVTDSIDHWAGTWRGLGARVAEPTSDNIAVRGSA